MPSYCHLLHFWVQLHIICATMGKSPRVNIVHVSSVLLLSLFMTLVKLKLHFKGVPKFFYIPCFLVLQDWLQCTNYQNSILFHHSLMYGFNRFNYVLKINFHLNGKSYVYEFFFKDR